MPTATTSTCAQLSPESLHILCPCSGCIRSSLSQHKPVYPIPRAPSLVCRELLSPSWALLTCAAHLRTQVQENLQDLNMGALPVPVGLYSSVDIRFKVLVIFISHEGRWPSQACQNMPLLDTSMCHVDLQFKELPVLRLAKVLPQTHSSTPYILFPPQSMIGFEARTTSSDHIAWSQQGFK